MMQTKLTYNGNTKKEEVEDFVESEILTVNNYLLVFLAIYNEANVVEKNGDNKKIIHSFPLNELTHEAAAQWIKKLRTYVLFQ
jgi:hypothetical protein